jgi:hypothetical protein
MVKAVEVVWADWKKTKCPECRGKLQIYSWHIPFSFGTQVIGASIRSPLNDPEYTTYELYCGRCLMGYFKNSYERLEELK